MNQEEEKYLQTAHEMGENATREDVKKVRADLAEMNRGPVKKVWDKVMQMWNTFLSPSTSSLEKTTIIGALIYLVSPIDVVPDSLPLVGLVDDVFVISTIYAILNGNMKTTSSKVDPQKGDILKVNRGIYDHYGIYAGDGKVVNFSVHTGEGRETDPRLADVIVSSLEEFSKGSQVYVVKETKDCPYQPFDPDVVVERAMSQVGKQRGQYSLVSKNCEHFAYWCRYGISKSQQVENVATFLVAALI